MVLAFVRERCSFFLQLTQVAGDWAHVIGFACTLDQGPLGCENNQDTESGDERDGRFDVNASRHEEDEAADAYGDAAHR